LPQPRRRNPSPLVLAGGASAFLAVVVGAWWLTSRASADARKARRLSPLATFKPQKPNLQQMTAASTGIRPYRSSTSVPDTSNEETSTSGSLAIRRGATA